MEATAVHPFYVVGRGFTEAGKLRVGDRVAEDQDGKTATLASVVRLGTPKPVYNLTVAGTHTYFVRAGGDDLWVHNAGCPHPKEPGWYLGTNRNGDPYVGMSKDVPTRIGPGHHQLDPSQPVDFFPAQQGISKRDLEIMEQTIINGLGGIGKTGNVRNPVSPKHWPKYGIPPP